MSHWLRQVLTLLAHQHLFLPGYFPAPAGYALPLSKSHAELQVGGT
jgi:hypothetical protein